jgi:hypothetical protein
MTGSLLVQYDVDPSKKTFFSFQFKETDIVLKGRSTGIYPLSMDIVGQNKVIACAEHRKINLPL